MNKDQILALWDTHTDYKYEKTSDMVLAFANAIREDALEEAAVKCDAKVDAEYATGKVDHNEMAWCMSCANAIRSMKGKP